MTVYTFTNTGNVDAGDGTDRLKYVATVDYGFHMNLYELSGDLASGYSGSFFANLESYKYYCSFTGIENFTFIDKGAGNDDIAVGDGNLRGGPGNDRLNSAGGIDTIYGGPGNDIWVADKSFATDDITINLNAAKSTYLGTGSVSGIEGMELKTGSGDDMLIGHRTAAMNDIIDAGAGNDTIKLWGGGFDEVHGGDGNDHLTFIHYADNFGFNLGVAGLSGDLATGYSGSFFRNLQSYALSVDFTGIESFTFIDKGGGNDDIAVGDGNDVLKSGAGDDWLNSGGGVDFVDGGTGNDMWVADKSFTDQDISINLNLARSTYLGTGVVKGIEGLNLMTGTGNDMIVGHRTAAMNDVISTGDGNDTIKLWGGGADEAHGGQGTDKLIYVLDTDDFGFRLTGLTPDADGYTGDFFSNLDSSRLSVGFSGIDKFVFIYGGTGEQRDQHRPRRR